MRTAAIAMAVAVATGSGQDYRQFKGQEKRFCGVVVEVSKGFQKCEAALLLGAHSDKWKIAALIPASLRGDLPQRADEYLFSEICATGTVAEEKKKPYVRLERASQLELRKAAEAPFGTGAARPCDDGFELPQPVHEVRPQYTARAMREKVEGKVMTQIVVDTDGSVAEARVVRALHPDLDATALHAVRQWKFKPATTFGKVVRSLVEVELTFTLRG